MLITLDEIGGVLLNNVYNCGAVECKIGSN